MRQVRLPIQLRELWKLNEERPTGHPIAGVLGIILPTHAVAEPQQEFAPPRGGPFPVSQSPQDNQALEVVPSQNNRILELPALVERGTASAPTASDQPTDTVAIYWMLGRDSRAMGSAVGNFPNRDHQ